MDYGISTERQKALISHRSDSLPNIPGRRMAIFNCSITEPALDRQELDGTRSTAQQAVNIRTTPPRPCDITVVFPQLAPLARTTTRLHHRAGSPSPYESSVGGPLLWPAEQPWLYCDKWHEGPVSPLVPVAQLYVRDVPQLRPPGLADLLQVLWCPSEHPPCYKPTTEVFWRTAADVNSVLAAPPIPADVQYGYMPQPCVVSPEQITEYPSGVERGTAGACQRLGHVAGGRRRDGG